jgi:hypothetical protein
VAVFIKFSVNVMPRQTQKRRGIDVKSIRATYRNASGATSPSQGPANGVASGMFLRQPS